VTQYAFEGLSSKLAAIKLVFGLDLSFLLCSEDSHMERPRNEITGTRNSTHRVNNRCTQMFLSLSMKPVPRSREGTAVLVKLRKHV